MKFFSHNKKKNGQKNTRIKHNLHDPRLTLHVDATDDIGVPQVTPLLPKKERPQSLTRIIVKIILRLILFLLICSMIIAGFFLWKASSVSKQVTGQSFIARTLPTSFSDQPQQTKPLLLEQHDRINILLLGHAGQKLPGANLTDTIMIASIDVIDKKIALLSLPRDLYVTIADTHTKTKINNIYQYGLRDGTGITPLINTIENIIAQEIHYYVIADFDGFTDAVDALGGINVVVQNDIRDTHYPGPNYSYETFEINKGLHTMDGATALKYVRYRHGDPDGDFGRAKRQQKVLQAIKNRTFSLHTILNPLTLNALLDTLDAHVRTNIHPRNIDDFAELTKQLDTQNITTVVVDAWKSDSLLRSASFAIGGRRASALVPRSGTYVEIHELAEHIFDRDTLKKRRELLKTEQAKLTIVNRSGNTQLPTRVSRFLTGDLGMDYVTIEQSSLSGSETTSFIVDHSGGTKPFTLDELIKKLPAQNRLRSVHAQNTDDSADLTVVLGKDLIAPYVYEEIAEEEFNKTQDASYVDPVEKK